MPQKFTNNAISTLFVDLNLTDSTMTITPGDETLFPTLNVGEFFKVTVESGSTREIIRVISTTANVFSVVRAQEGTSATTFTAGATVALRVTGQFLEDLSPIDLSDNVERVTGVLDALNGGTGFSAFTVGDILFANSNNTLALIPIGTPNSIFSSVGGVPVWDTDPSVNSLSIVTNLLMGSNPAQSGIIRIPNTQAIVSRNSANNADIVIVSVDANDNLVIGGVGVRPVIQNNAALSSFDNAGTSVIELIKLDTGDVFRVLREIVLNNTVSLSGRDSLDSINIPLISVDANDNIIIGNGLNNDIGYGQLTPTARHHFAGSMGFSDRNVSSNFSFLDDFFVAVDASAQNITGTLPPLSSSRGRIYIVKRLDNNEPTTTLTIQTTGGDTIEDGVSTTDTLTAQNQVKMYMGTSTEWKRIIG